MGHRRMAQMYPLSRTTIATEMQPPDWLLPGMLERRSFALIYGEGGCGKSLLCLDWACRIATGTPWRGHEVQAAPVVYITADRRSGLARRVAAWQQHHGVSMAGAPVFVGPAAAICEPDVLDDLIASVEQQCPTPALVVLDSLSRCFAGDEDSARDMNQFISACDQLRQRWDCTVLVVHHDGHGDTDRTQAAIALSAALDAEYRLLRTDRLLLTATKLRDGQIPPPLAMSLVKVDLPGVIDDEGNAVTSVAIGSAGAERTSQNKAICNIYNMSCRVFGNRQPNDRAIENTLL